MSRTTSSRTSRGFVRVAYAKDACSRAGSIREQLGCCAIASLLALALPGCQGGRPGRGSAVESARRAVTTVPAPGADTPLSALAAAVNDANAKLADLVAAVNDEGAVDQTSDDVALVAAKLGNAAAKTIEQTDVRELEQTSAKKVEGAAAAAHASAAGLVQMAAKVMGGSSANDMVGEMGAAVAGANTSAVTVADAAAKLAAAGDICGSKMGHKDNLNQASVAMSGAKSAADGLASAANNAAQSASGSLALALGNLATVASDNSASATDLINALDAAKAGMEGSNTGAGLETVSSAAASHKVKAGNLADAAAQVAGAMDPGSNSETLAKLMQAGAGNALATATNAEQDALKKLASAIAAGQTAGAAMSAAANKEQKTGTNDSKANLASIAEEANHASAKVANGAAKATEASASVGASAASQKQTDAAIAAAHVMAASLAQAAAAEMTADDTEGDPIAIPELAAMMAAARNAQGRLAEAAAKAIEGAAPATELSELVAMTGTAAAAA
ncbi:MAG TPA: hypothetical protein VJ801_08020, partial [Polyangia bacterium]|nr:hypothetical protein [Polyangia bacterium]